MTSEDGDSDTLKRRVVELLLQNPQGIRFEDFSGAFHQLHGYHPRIAFHGYHTLKNLVADMENVVVVESNSQQQLMKIAKGFRLNRWLEGEKGNELETSEGEVENLRDEDQVGDQTTLANILGLLISLLREYSSGLRISYIQKFMLSRHAVDMEKFSIAQGYRNIMEFLEYELSGLIIRYQEKTCEYVVQIPEDFFVSDLSLDSDFSTWSSQSSTQDLTRTNSASSLYCTWRSDPNHVKEPTKHIPDLPAASKLIQGVLNCFPCGIKICKLKRLLRKKHGFDLETFCSQQGYQDMLSCLKDIPELLLLNTNKRRNCLIRLQPCPFGSNLSLDSDFSGCSSHSKPPGLTRTHSVLSLEGTSSCTPSLDTSFSAGHTNAEPKTPTAANSAVSLPSTSVSVPNHVKEPPNQALAIPEVLALVNDLLAKYESGLRIKKIQEFLMDTKSFDLEKFSIIQGHKDSLEFLQRQMHHLSYMKRSTRFNCVVKLGKKAKKKQSQSHPQNGTTKKNPSVASVPPLMNAPVPQSTKPRLDPFVACVPPLINAPVLQSTKPLEPAYSESDPSVACVPPLMNAPVPQSTKPLEPAYSESGVGNISKPSDTFHDFSASKSQSQSMSFLDSSIPQEIKNLIHSSTHIQLPSFHEVRSASPAKPNNLRQSISNGPPQKRNVSQFGGPSLVEEMPCQLNKQLSSKSNMTKDTPSKDQVELKQQVAHILSMHPEGMSLFQFRAAYSATYQQHFPMGNAASAKQRLQEMPDVVCMKSYGVQTRLLPVSSAMSSPKSGQPITATMEKAPVAPGLSQPRTVSLAQKNSKELEGDDKKEDYPFLAPLLHQVAKPRASVQEEVKKNPKPMRAPVIPQPPVGCHTYAQVTASGKPLKPNSFNSKPTHLKSPSISANSASVPSHSNDPCISANCASLPSHPNDPCISANRASLSSHPNDPCISANRTSLPSTFHPASSYNFGTWAQPVSYPSVLYVPQMPEISPIKVAYNQVSRYPSRIQFQNPTVQSSTFAQPPHVLPIKYHPTTYLTQSTEQWSNIHTLPQAAAYSPMQTLFNGLQNALNPTFLTGGYLVSPSSRNMFQTVQQLECYNHTQQDGLQHSSVAVKKKSFTVTSLDTEPKPPASAYQTQYIDCDSLASAANTVPFLSQRAWSTSQFFQPLETSSSSKRNPNALLFEPPVFVDQQQSVSASATITTSSYSPPSLVNATVSPYDNHLSLSRNSNNPAVQPPEPQASVNQQQYASLNTSAITSNRKQPGSSPCPQDLPIRSSRQLSITPLSVCTDYEPPVQANPVVSFSKHVDNDHVSLPKKQTSYSPPNSPLKKPDRCVIL